MDGGAWKPAELRTPLSGLTWVIWRYDWPFKAGDHVFAVRAYDGTGQLQITASNSTFPSGATGIDTMTAPVLPLGRERGLRRQAAQVAGTRRTEGTSPASGPARADRAGSATRVRAPRRRRPCAGRLVRTPP